MKSLVVSVCITAVTDMAAVSLLVFFWCSSGFFWVLLVFFCVIEHQKNARRTPEGTPEEPRRTQKEKNTSPPYMCNMATALATHGPLDFCLLVSCVLQMLLLKLKEHFLYTKSEIHSPSPGLPSDVIRNTAVVSSFRRWFLT